MSNHNYSQYSNKNRNNQNNKYNNQNKPKQVEKAPEVKMDSVPVIDTPVVQPKPKLMNETVETTTLPNTVEGVVAHCAKLNVRENATVDSGIVCVLDAMSEIEIDVNKSTSNWFYIYSATGAEGYCMRQYVDAHM